MLGKALLIPSLLFGGSGGGQFNLPPNPNSGQPTVCIRKSYRETLPKRRGKKSICKIIKRVIL